MTSEYASSLAKLGNKPKRYINKCNDHWLNVTEGGKRAGKNVINILAFCRQLELHKNHLHLVAGVTIATAKINVIDCDGFGIAHYFAGRCREGKYKDRDCLYINTITGEKVVLISGGETRSDYKKIKGNTYGMAYVTEANECHESFIKEVFTRTLSSTDIKIFFDLNPFAPSHWFYTEILDPHEEKQKENPEYGYNWEHFTIFDNMSISNEALKRRLDAYDKNSFWYKSDILGHRLMPAGRIYTTYKPETHDILFKDINFANVSHVNMGEDFGSSGSASVFIAVAFSRDMSTIYVIDEYWRKGNKMYKHGEEFRLRSSDYDTEELADDFYKFAVDLDREVGKLYKSFYDSAEPRQGKRFKAKNPPINVYPCLKQEINDRIIDECKLFRYDRIFITERCPMLKEALANAVYDEDGNRLDNGTVNIDSLDAFEYAVAYEMRKISDRIKE